MQKHNKTREPLNQSAAACSGSFAPTFRFENLEIRKGFLRFPNLDLEQNSSLTALVISSEVPQITSDELRKARQRFPKPTHANRPKSPALSVCRRRRPDQGFCVADAARRESGGDGGIVGLRRTAARPFVLLHGKSEIFLKFAEKQLNFRSICHRIVQAAEWGSAAHPEQPREELC